jgi:hypothetical protein
MATLAARLDTGHSAEPAPQEEAAAGGLLALAAVLDAVARALRGLAQAVRDARCAGQAHAARAARLAQDLADGDVHAAQRNVRRMVACSQRTPAARPHPPLEADSCPPLLIIKHQSMFACT